MKDMICTHCHKSIDEDRPYEAYTFDVHKVGEIFSFYPFCDHKCKLHWALSGKQRPPMYWQMRVRSV